VLVTKLVAILSATTLRTTALLLVMSFRPGVTTVIAEVTFETNHNDENFSHTYADHVFRIFSLKGDDTGYLYSS
jgi:hypothetical protein